METLELAHLDDEEQRIHYSAILKSAHPSVEARYGDPKGDTIIFRKQAHNGEWSAWASTSAHSDVGAWVRRLAQGNVGSYHKPSIAVALTRMLRTGAHHLRNGTLGRVRKLLSGGYFTGRGK
ncbi:hypothetical protein D1223_00200 [Henriciella mobilis]|uniref:Uncharacterized protein n=1 Tax=Henriciella mobilis TaxID=2305467 RepID=A0A399RRZ8_9PROT|nr:hypothetical protein D1223_00200 [Henriciella mobilis]